MTRFRLSNSVYNRAPICHVIVDKAQSSQNESENFYLRALEDTSSSSNEEIEKLLDTKTAVRSNRDLQRFRDLQERQQRRDRFSLHRRASPCDYSHHISHVPQSLTNHAMPSCL